MLVRKPDDNRRWTPKTLLRRTGPLSWFVLPPVEKRHIAQGSLKRLTSPRFTAEADDGYIYYLLYKYSWLVGSTFSLMYGLSYCLRVSFKFYFFTIRIDPRDVIHSVMWSYPFVVPTVLFSIFLPLGWLLLRVNVDLNSYELRRWDEAIGSSACVSRGKLLRKYFAFVVFFLAGPYMCFGYPYMILKHYPDLHDSGLLFVLLMAFDTWIDATSVYVVVMGAAIFYQHWKRLGPCYRDISDLSCSK
jgi:hypothetical protein